MPRLGNVEVTNTVTLGLKAWSAEAQRALTSEMVRATTGLQNGMRQRLVWRRGKGQPGGRFTGQLSRSISTAVQSSPHRIEGTVGSGVKYAKFVEGWNSKGQKRPPRRHFVTFRTAPGYRLWLLRHGVQLRPNAKGYPAGGPDAPSPFMEPTLREYEPTMAKRFAAALVRTMRG